MAQFSLFPRLPPEIRHQIWLEALSKHSEPGKTPLFYFKKGCWRFRYLKPGEALWEPGDDNLYLGFEHERLDPLRYDHPLFHVNWEARSVARLWARSRGVKEDAPLLMARSFDIDRDTLYVSGGELGDLIVEPIEKPWEEGIFDMFSTNGPFWRSLALPFWLLRDNPTEMAELSMQYDKLRVIYVIVKAEPEDFWHFQSTEHRERQWWELQGLEEAPDASLYCDEDNEFHWSGYTPELDRYGLNEVLGPAATEMIKEENTLWKGIEIRPVRVVRKSI